MFLEHSETVDSPFASKSAAVTTKASKRVFAEQHISVINTVKTGISLQIPVGSTPDFSTSAVSLQWVVRFEFITGLSRSLLHPAPSDVHFVHSGVLNFADVEAFDCIIPIKVYPTQVAKKPWARNFEIL
jgi:hypothetical protein